MLLISFLLFLLTSTLALAAPRTRRQGAPAAGEIVPYSIISHDLTSETPNTCLGAGERPSAWRNVSADLPGGEAGRTVLFAFQYTAASEGRRCWLELRTTPPTDLRPDPAVAQLDVFRQREDAGPATCGGADANNRRDAHLGRLHVIANGPATWIQIANGHLTAPVPCRTPGTIEGFEIVAVGDNVGVTFPQGEGAGLRIVHD